MARTGDFGVFSLEFIPLVPAVPCDAMDDDAERRRGCLAGLAREKAVDMIGRRFAVVENCLGSLVRRRHDLKNASLCETGGGRTRATYVDVGPVDRKRAFLLSNNHRHLSVHGIFLHKTAAKRTTAFQKRALH